MFNRIHLIGCVLAVVSTCALGQRVFSCPFCATVKMTLTEEITNADVAAFARLVELPRPTEVEELSGAGFDSGQSAPHAKFEIVEVLKGNEHIGQTRMIDIVYFGEGPPGQMFLIIGVDAPNIGWATPLSLSERAQEYIPIAIQLPEGEAARLIFFQDYLEDADELLLRDAYDEFAKASYDGVKSIKDKMKHDQLMAWIQDTEIPVTRRRLYLTMLGVCGNAEDGRLIESMIQSDDRQVKAGLDAIIACYLSLVGEQGLPLIADRFLKNQDAEYTDTYAAIMALRFHGNQGGVIDRPPLIEALRHMLDRTDLADLVIPDLVRWEDWESLPRLVHLFKTSDEESSWLRVPVFNYLRECPLPEAKVAIDELAAIDPDAFQRSTTFFRSTNQADGSDQTAETIEGDGQTVETIEEGSQSEPATPDIETTDSPDEEEAEDVPSKLDGSTGKTADRSDGQGARNQPPGSLVMLGIPFLLGISLFAAIWIILRRPPAS